MVDIKNLFAADINSFDAAIDRIESIYFDAKAAGARKDQDFPEIIFNIFGQTSAGKIGVIGGMGPFATIDFLRNISKNIKEKNLRIPSIVVGMFCKTPDRAQEARKGRDPQNSEVSTHLQRAADIMKDLDVKYLSLACNGAHHWVRGNVVKVAQNLYFLDFIHLTAYTIESDEKLNQKDSRILLLANEASYRTKLYQRSFSKIGLQLVIPDERDQGGLMDAIYGDEGIKAGFYGVGSKAEKIIDAIIEKYSPTAVISGCTEIVLALDSGKLNNKKITLIDPVNLVTNKLLEFSFEGVKKVRKRA